MKKRYDKKRHKGQFIQSGNFCVPLEYYLELSESKRKYMFLNTRLILDQMVLVEQNTCIIRKGLSESRCLELARSVVAIADAFKEHISKRQNDAGENISEDSFGSKEEILEQQGWDEFKKWRFVKAYSDVESMIEDHQEVQESVHYTERGVIFDYIYETWKQAVLNKDVSDTCVSNVSVSRANESIQAVNAKADFQQRQQDRMKAFVGHLKGGDYVMLDGR